MHMNSKILILGGKPIATMDIVDCAQKKNMYVIVTDYLPCSDSPAKQIADEYWDISTDQTEIIANKVVEQKIMGIFSGVHEFNIEKAMQICDITGLPFYATKEQFEMLMDKKSFKRLCRNQDIPVVQEYHSVDPMDREFYQNLKYPVLLKPNDNSGGRGIRICYAPKEFPSMYKDSLGFSKSQQVLIERYMKNEEATIFYILQDGEIRLTAMGDRHIQHFKDGVIPLPVAYTFPSKYLDEYEKNLNDKVIEMFRSLGMKNGMVFIQSFIEDGKCVFYEMGYRITGSLEYKLINHCCGFDPLDMMIEQAVYGRSNVDLDKLVNPHFPRPYCNITFLIMPGTIGKIEGVEAIRSMPNIIDVVLSYKEGDTIPQTSLGTLQQVVARVFAYAETESQLADLMDDVHRRFDVLSDNGASMLLPVFNTNYLRS